MQQFQWHMQPLEVVFHYSRRCYAVTSLEDPQELRALPDRELPANHRADDTVPLQNLAFWYTSQVLDWNGQFCSGKTN